MTNELTLLTKENFGGAELDSYRNEGLKLVTTEKFAGLDVEFYRNENNEVFMTRNQIGQALGYAQVQRAMNKIHERNKERLDKFSMVVKLGTTNGKAYDTHLYSEKGIYEIMRKSNQPKADEFYDFVYEVIEGLRKGELQVTETKVYSYMIDDPAKRARLWADEMDEVYAIIHEKEEENQQLTQVVEEAKPKVQAFEQAMEIDKLHSMKEVANLMGVGRNTLFAQLREAKILNESNLPYQRYINSGHFQMKHIVKNKYYSCNVVLATQKGMGWLVMNKDKIMNKK